MPIFDFEDPKTGRIYSIEGPKGSTKNEAAAELQRRIDTGEIAQISIGTEKGRKTNTGSAEYTPPKPPPPQKPSIDKQVKDVLKGSIELPTAIATGAAANLAGNLSGAAYEYIANPTRHLLGKADIANPSEVRATLMNDYTYRPTSESGKASLAALGTLTTPIKIIGDAASKASQELGGSKFTNELIGDVAMAVAPGQAIKGVKKVVEIAPNIASAASPIKAYDAAANSVYKAQVKARDFLRDKEAITPPGKFKSAVSSVKRTVNALGSDAGANTASIGAALAGNPLAVIPIQVARHLRKRGAENFGKTQKAAKAPDALNELADSVKNSILSPDEPINTFKTEAVGTIGSQNLDELVKLIKSDISQNEGF